MAHLDQLADAIQLVLWFQSFWVWTRPPAVWWAIISVLNASVLAAELFNTALENVLDFVHSQMHPLVGQGIDCAAAAALVLSLSSLAVFRR